MTYRINPAFDRFPAEASIIGRILASFGEIELSICRNAGNSINLQGVMMKALYRLRATSQQIDVADEFMRWQHQRVGLGSEYEILMGMVRHCLKIRNLYSHCNWGDHITGGLFFADVQESAETDNFDHYWKHVDPPLLQRQLDYFALTMEWVEYLDHELALRQRRLQSHVWPKPPEQEPPLPHNPEDQHVPPWLSEDRKALHLARALASRGGPPTPTRGQQALDKARAEKRARQAEHQQKSAEGERRAKERSDPSET